MADSAAWEKIGNLYDTINKVDERIDVTRKRIKTVAEDTALLQGIAAGMGSRIEGSEAKVNARIDVTHKRIDELAGMMNATVDNMQAGVDALRARNERYLVYQVAMHALPALIADAEEDEPDDISDLVQTAVDFGAEMVRQVESRFEPGTNATRKKGEA